MSILLHTFRYRNLKLLLFSKHNCQAYVVGGFVRDWLLDRQTADIDIAVGGDTLGIAQKVAEAIDGRYVLLDETNMVARVVIADEHLWHHAKHLVVLDYISERNGAAPWAPNRINRWRIKTWWARL